jgi:hypothetical protein
MTPAQETLMTPAQEGLWYCCIAPLTTTVFADSFALVRAQGEEVERVVLHPRDYADLLKTGSPHLLSHSLTKEEASLMQATGVYPAKLFGAEVESSLEVVAGRVEVHGPTLVAYIEVYR